MASKTVCVLLVEGGGREIEGGEIGEASSGRRWEKQARTETAQHPM